MTSVSVGTDTARVFTPGTMQQLPVKDIGLSAGPLRQIRPLDEGGVSHLMDETTPDDWDAIIVRAWPPVESEPFPAGEGPYEWQVVAGYHRVTAARRLCLATIAADIREIKTDAEFLLVALTTNLRHGVQMTRDEQVAVLRRLREVEGISIGDLAKQTGIKRGTLQNWLSGRDTNAARPARHAPSDRREDPPTDEGTPLLLPADWAGPAATLDQARLVAVGGSVNRALSAGDLTAIVPPADARAWWAAQSPSVRPGMARRIRAIAAWWSGMAAVAAVDTDAAVPGVAAAGEEAPDGTA